MSDRPRDPEVERRERDDDEPGALLRDTHRELRHRGPWRRPARPDRHPVARERPEAEIVPIARPPREIRRDSPAYWRWSAMLIVAVAAAGVIAAWVATSVAPADGPAWPWLLVGAGEIVAGGALLWTSWPRTTRDVDWRRALGGSFGGLLVAFGVLSLVWALRAA